MEVSYSETESAVFPSKTQTMRKQKKKKNSSKGGYDRSKEEENWPRKNKVTLEGYIEPMDHRELESNGNNIVGRTKSLTDEDLEELKGCLDLGFGFSYDEIPELCNTLPALELCYSMSQKYLGDHHRASDSSSEDYVTFPSSSSSSSQVANWKISSPGDHPDEVKARLKYWAQAVACTIRLCNKHKFHACN